jgi:Replication-relaxation
VASALGATLRSVWRWAPGGIVWWSPLAALALLLGAPIGISRPRARHRRRYARMRVETYRTDKASAAAVVEMYEALHKRLLRRWWRRLLHGQPSVALEVHHAGGSVWLAVTCPVGLEGMVEAALRTAYPNCRLTPERQLPGSPPTVLRLKKHAEFIKRAKVLDIFEREREHKREPAMNQLMTVMSAGAEAFVQVAITPTPALFEHHAKRLYKRHEAHLSRERRGHFEMRDPSVVERSELLGGLDVQHRPLFFADLRVIACDRIQCEQIASELRAGEGENRLVERGTTVRHGLLGMYTRRVQRGEGNPLPSFHKGVFASTELAAIWHLPSIDYATVPFARSVLPVVPAPSAILRPADGVGTLRDGIGVVSIHPGMRKQNTAVPGTVEQGKSSYLVATVAEDLRRERCAVIVLDPKGDAAEAAVSLVPEERTCTLLDLAHPTCGFNPLAVNAPADVIADYVVAALKNLFSDADIRASSDRYLRNAIIAVLAFDRNSTLWDAGRLLSVGEEGYAYRNRVIARIRMMPEFKEIYEFFAAELTAQLADSRSTTTAKLDAPVNKLARLLNSQSIKRVLLNDSLRVDFDRVIAGEEVLVVKGALGAMGAGNTSVLMQLLVGMLDAALARQQDLVPETERVAVALKVDEAPLVLNRGFAETMALKRSAGLETVACWQTDAQWIEREVRDQLDALFAHRVYFATASVRDARTAVGLTMAEFSDQVNPRIEHLSTLGHPDARLHLPRHHAIASWSTPEGRQSPFVAETIPMRVDRERLAMHATRQEERGGRYRTDLRQPHWDRGRNGSSGGGASRERNGTSGGDPTPPPTDARDRSERFERAPANQAATPAREYGSQRAPAEAITPTKQSASPSAEEQQRKGGEEEPTNPGVAPDSYRELIELDGAHNVRWAKRVTEPRPLEAEPLDLEILTLVACMRHVLSSQIHRRFNPGRAATTTQRRLKRLSDAGLVRRFQFHRRDGGGVPMCYAITAPGLLLLHAHDRLTALEKDDVQTLSGPPSPAAPVEGDRLLRQARHDVHVAGWALALEHAVDGAPLAMRGARESVLEPPLRSTQNGRVALGPSDLTLPSGRTPHEFLRTGQDGGRMQVERFETVRPDATIELRGRLRERIAAQARARELGVAEGMSAEDTVSERGAGMGVPAARAGTVDLLVELDDRLPEGRAAGKLERYDHLVAGWSVHVPRYGRRLGVPPLVVFVCRDRARARECARRADAVLTACRAYAGEYPADWEYPGRERIMFVAERDAHGGSMRAYGVPRLPPDVRVSVAHGDPRAGESAAELRELLTLTPIDE